MNEPGYVAHVAEYIATLKDVSLREVAQQTTDNFFNLFKVPRDQ
jgi:TatD DNase family protein